MSTVKWNNAAVTPEGFNLQAELLQGGGIEFTRVTGADADGNNKITLSMQPSTVANARITVPVLLSNTSLSEGFQMTQLRFYAKGTGGAPEYEILYAVAQDAEGDYIPSSSESPGFTIDWSYTFQFGNADNVTVELDPAGLVSFSTVGQPNGVAPLGADGKIPDEYLDGTAGSSIAPPYDPENTYDQGDYCTYNGALYQANVDIDTPEAWNESHWTAVSVTEQFIPNTEKGAASGVATLDTSGKLTPDQKPSYTAAEVGADEEGSAAEVQTNLSAHTGNTNNPHSVTAAQVGAIPFSQKGAPGGVAELGEDGKVPSANLGALGGSRLEITFDESFEGLPYTIAGGEESYSGTVPESLEAVHSLLAVDTDYTLTVTDATEDETYTRTVHTDDWYTALAVSIAPFAATITVNCPAGSTVKCANGGTELQQTATSGTAVFTVGNAGTWTVTATLGDDSASGEVVISASGESKSITLSYFSSTITVNCPAGSSVTCEKGDDTQTKTATGGTAVFTVTSAGTWEITATLDGETATGEVVISASGEQKTITLAYVHIYGVLWDGTSSTVLSRTNDAQDFTDPVPAVNNGNGSSPFDTLQPWAGMTRETDSAAGELVKIPKYWYKWTKSGNTVALQIADKEVEGFSVSPAHCDRGDGHGERDVVYVGRYHCHTSNWKSQTGGKPKADITRSAARSGIHNLGSTIWQWDWAMSWTIKMLYLVEYADWNSQAKIGYGCGNNSATENMGATDGMTYHTGTSKANRTTYGVGVQYRHIEGLWDNVYDWVDGCYYSSAGLNIILNPSNFSDSSGGTSIGTPSSGYPSALGVKTALNGMWIIPTAASGSDSTYVPDSWGFGASVPCLCLGGYYGQGQSYGLFCVDFNAASYSYSGIGSRLMKLP